MGVASRAMAGADMVSVVIPVYNSEQWLDDTFESIMNQSWLQQGHPLEISCFDDGGTDGSYAKILQWRDRFVATYSDRVQFVVGRNLERGAGEDNDAKRRKITDAAEAEGLGETKHCKKCDR